MKPMIIPLSMSSVFLLPCQGDVAASFLLWAGTHYCTVFMTDMKAAYHTWQKMLDADAQIIYPAHGRPFPAARLHQNMGRITNKTLAPFF